MLTFIDVRCQIATSTVVPQKGVSSYAITEAKRLLYEVGKSNAISQTDDEAYIKAAAEELARQINGLSVRATLPMYKESQ